MKKSAIVVTTIFEPAFLGDYVANLEAHGRSRDVDIIVIVDRRTPRSMEEACRQHRAQGYSVLCPSLDAQERFVSRLPDMAGRIPYDSDNRRDIGFLMALVMSAIISRTIARPLQHIADATAAVAQGHYDRQVPVNGPPEIAQRRGDRCGPEWPQRRRGAG